MYVKKIKAFIKLLYQIIESFFTHNPTSQYHADMISRKILNTRKKNAFFCIKCVAFLPLTNFSLKNIYM